jgi:hypothetical protein
MMTLVSTTTEGKVVKTEDPEEAQARAQEQGLQVEWIHDPEQGRILQTRYHQTWLQHRLRSETSRFH